jgi:hypothetical protein
MPESSVSLGWITAQMSRNYTTDEIFSHGWNTDKTRILTVGKTVSWDNSTEKEKKNLGTLIYDNLRSSVDCQMGRSMKIGDPAR